MARLGDPTAACLYARQTAPGQSCTNIGSSQGKRGLSTVSLPAQTKGTGQTRLFPHRYHIESGPLRGSELRGTAACQAHSHRPIKHRVEANSKPHQAQTGKPAIRKGSMCLAEMPSSRTGRHAFQGHLRTQTHPPELTPSCRGRGLPAPAPAFCPASAEVCSRPPTPSAISKDNAVVGTSLVTALAGL